MLAAVPARVTDSVDALLDSWRAKRPDLDFTPVGIVARIGRVRGHVERELEPVFAAHGLSGPSFSVLVTLARIGDEGGVSQRRLMDELGLTSGTISVRMDRLVEQGLVDRRPDPASKRNSLITLTERGRELFERVVPAHLANERRLLSALDDDERALLAGLLRKLLVEFEGSRPSAGGAPLGLTVAPAHVAMALREAVGLPAVPGLLVRSVQQDGPACAAGLRTGDVLVRAGGRELRSVDALYAALADVAHGLELRVLRGTQEADLIVPMATGPGTAATCGRGAAAEHAL
jgi:DNA-binding MarR family transcriptional regulator